MTAAHIRKVNPNECQPEIAFYCTSFFRNTGISFLMKLALSHLKINLPAKLKRAPRKC